jgi:hypothetical protein
MAMKVVVNNMTDRDRIVEGLRKMLREDWEEKHMKTLEKALKERKAKNPKSRS